MKIKAWGDTKGLTLAEVVVGIGILAVISTFMLIFVIQGSNLWNLLISESDLRSYGRNAMNFMAQELRNATRTSTQTPSPNLVIPSKPNNRSVDFYLPKDMDNNGLIIDALGATEWDKSNKIQYQYVPGQKMLRRLEKGNHFTIAQDISSIEFEDNTINASLQANELKILLTLSRNLPAHKTATASFTSIIKLRNQ